MPNFIRMEVNSSGRVNINLDLNHYINTYEKAYGAHVPVGPAQATAITEFKELLLEMYQHLDGVQGGTYWINALSLATQHLEKAEQDAIKASPASKMMDNSFIEIIKNSMDQVISMHYDSHQRQEPTIQLSLDINVDQTFHPTLISIRMTDSGHGFPEEFLDKVSTKKSRDTYVNTSRGSHKEQDDDRPPLFGGQGRGLRILIADEDGDVLERSGTRIHRFTKPEVSSVKFANAQGAQITVTTSMEPRTEFAEKANKIKADLRAYTTASPDSVATTHESISSRDETPTLSFDFLDSEDEDDLKNYDNLSPKISPKR
jgi:hypothetical protein